MPTTRLSGLESETLTATLARTARLVSDAELHDGTVGSAHEGRTRHARRRDLAVASGVVRIRVRACARVRQGLARD